MAAGRRLVRLGVGAIVLIIVCGLLAFWYFAGRGAEGPSILDRGREAYLGRQWKDAPRSGQRSPPDEA